MTEQIRIGNILVDVVFKNIKNVHLSVHPPTGRVRISAPSRMKLDTIRVYAISRIDWIKKHQTKMQAQERETPREYLERESHYVWGKRYLLVLNETQGLPSVDLQHNKIVLSVRPNSTFEKKNAVVSAWYREQVRIATLPLITKWESIMGVSVSQCYVQKMKTKWGSCNPQNRSIRLNSELAKKPAECLEYIIVHEMTHLLEPTHNARFYKLMDQFIPKWRVNRDQLNRLPIRYEEWEY